MATIKEHIWDKHECKCSYCKHQVGKLVDETLRLFVKWCEDNSVQSAIHTGKKSIFIPPVQWDLKKKDEGIE